MIYRIFTWFMHTKVYANLHYLVFGNVELRMHRLNQLAVSAACLHQATFPQFKNKYQGRDVAIVACGPSLKDFHPIRDCVHIGVNRSFEKDGLPLDYLFVVDGAFPREKMREINAYRRGQCVKFYGIHDEDSPMVPISEADAIDAGALRFRVDCDCTPVFRGFEPRLAYDISTQPLGTFGSIVFPALQFALWTNPKRIFLVGCDCTESGMHFFKDELPTYLPVNSLFKGYHALKRLVAIYYPDTEIISVNPVGLKGMFRDWYQKDGPLV